jgi:hypothetical protein
MVLPKDNQHEKKFFKTDLRFLTVGPELSSRLGDLLETAYADLEPRNFPERHLVDELAMAKWRGLRAALMEKAVYEHEHATFAPKGRKDSDGKPLEPHEDMYHLAMAHAPERHGVVLAALGRLAIRYQRQFANALRLLITLRRGTPPPVPEPLPETPFTKDQTPKDQNDEFPNQHNQRTL